MSLRKGMSPIHRSSGPIRLPNFVHDIRSAQCVFCPYGAEVKVGDRVIAWDDRTVFDRMPRERFVEITAIKAFRTNGRVVTLDFAVAPELEVARIAEDSETSVDALLDHRNGLPTYDALRTPVVVYFRPCHAGDDVLQLVPDLDVRVREPLRIDLCGLLWMRFKQWLRGWVWRNS